MNNCYIDDTALTFRAKPNISNPRIPNVQILGGVLISIPEEIKLIRLIKSVKSKYTHPNLPIKWNMRDTSITKIYRKFGRYHEYERLLNDSTNWRREIFVNSLAINYKVFISCIENYQIEIRRQQPIRDNISSFLFANILMRIALYIKKTGTDNLQIVLDWPPGNNPKPYNDEYYYAYNGGISTSCIEYYSGKLIDLNFGESVYFSKCTHSTMLQFSDLIIGVFKDSFEKQLKNDDSSISKELSDKVIVKLDGYPNNIKGRGINISTQNITFRKIMNRIIESYVP